MECRFFIKDMLISSCVFAVGASLAKVVYRSNKDYKDGKPIFTQVFSWMPMRFCMHQLNEFRLGFVVLKNKLIMHYLVRAFTSAKMNRGDVENG